MSFFVNFVAPVRGLVVNIFQVLLQPLRQILRELHGCVAVLTAVERESQRHATVGGRGQTGFVMVAAIVTGYRLRA